MSESSLEQAVCQLDKIAWKGLHARRSPTSILAAEYIFQHYQPISQLTYLLISMWTLMWPDLPSADQLITEN